MSDRVQRLPGWALARHRLARRLLGRGWILVVVAAAVLVCAVVALGAEPSATPMAVLEGGDPRSDNAAPGLVGSPLLVLAGVIALGLATALVTALVARLTRHD